MDSQLNGLLENKHNSREFTSTGVSLLLHSTAEQIIAFNRGLVSFSNQQAVCIQ